MKEIRILWLYSDLLDLYGDSGNIRILQYYFNKHGFDVSVDSIGIFDQPNFDKYDFIYCGPGKLKNLISANEHFRKHKEEFKKVVEKGIPILFCGSAILLLGNKFRDSKGNEYEASGVFDFTATDMDQVMTADIITECDFCDRKIYGFINRTAKIDGETADILRHGYHDKSLWATFLMGPLLVKNPDLLIWYFERITGIKLDMSGTLEEEAYLKTISEFE